MQIGDFVCLEAIRTRKDGALLDWGRPEPLFLPVDEQAGEVAKGDWVVVYITTDDRVFERPMASMLLDDFFQRDTSELEANQQVEILIFDRGQLGYDAVINNKFRGILYHNEVFGEVEYGGVMTAYVKKVRDDGKVDLMGQLRGTRGTTDLGQVILEELKARGGFLPITDKSAPEEIYDLFGVSKKKYKMAVGRLFKHQDVIIEEDGVRLNPEKPSERGPRPRHRRPD